MTVAYKRKAAQTHVLKNLYAALKNSSNILLNIKVPSIKQQQHAMNDYEKI